MTVLTRGDARLLLRPEEAAELTGVGRTTIYEAMRRGELRSIKIGKSRRITPEALRQWIAALEERTDGAA